jgi:N-acetyl-D-muramate 6-phosphate phosphatase
MPPPLAVLFDLDGTLLDTAPNMIAAVNVLRREHNLPALSAAQLRSSVSHGSARLVRVGFPEIAAEQLAPLQARFLEIYRADLSSGTALFPGMEQVLDVLDEHRIAVGVVTNKPGWLTDPLMSQLGLTSRFACIVSGDTVAERKPHPLPLQHAAMLAGATPASCVYVGDAQRDIQAARAAGMHALIARYGYIGAEDAPDQWGGDADLWQPAQLLEWLRSSGRL